MQLFIHWFIHSFIDSFIDWMIHWLNDSLIHWWMDWLTDCLNMVFSAWLEPVPNNPLKAYCRYCHVKLLARFTILRQHANTSKHIQNQQCGLDMTASDEGVAGGWNSCTFVNKCCFFSEKSSHLLGMDGYPTQLSGSGRISTIRRNPTPVG